MMAVIALSLISVAIVIQSLLKFNVIQKLK